MRNRAKTGFFLGVLLLNFVACANDPVGKCVPVKGTVTVNGKVLQAGSVTFWPIDAKGTPQNLFPSGEIAKGGTYELYTNKKKGAPPGKYKVTVTAQETPEDPKNTNPKDIKKIKQLVPVKYTKKDSTTLEHEVVDGENKTYDLTMEK